MNKYLLNFLTVMLFVFTYVATVDKFSKQIFHYTTGPPIKIVISNQKCKQKIIFNNHLNWNDFIEILSQNQAFFVTLYISSLHHTFNSTFKQKCIILKEDENGILREMKSNVPIMLYKNKIGYIELLDMNEIAVALKFKKSTKLPKVLNDIIELKKKGFKYFMYLK